MTRSLAHRGPDGQGLAVFGRHDGSIGVDVASWPQHDARGECSVGLGHRRLSIIDTSDAGHQPMGYRSRYWITYNGEIYNFIELRSELKVRGYEFKSGTDTEVIMAAYDCWGEQCLNRFNGMWAFALFDTVENVLLIARDRLGVKPLYFYYSAGEFLFASEVKAFLHAGCHLAPNEEMVRSFLGDNPNHYRPETLFSGVTTLAPASYVMGTPDAFVAGRAAARKFWSLEVNTSNEPFNEQSLLTYATRYEELLEDAVRLRLRADVPIGSALSGGLDSTSIVHFVNRQLHAVGSGSLQRVFSSTYPSPEHRSIDESPVIRNMVEAYKLDARETTPTAEAARNEYARMIYAMDEPPVGTCMSGWMTFKLVSESGVKVTLDGQGADEQLAGYLYYFTYWLSQSSSLATDAFQAAKLGRARRFTAAGVLFNLASRLHMQGAVRAALRMAGKLHDPFMSLNARLRDDTFGILSRLLHYADRISMAHSVESRMPFLDYRMVEFLASVPAAYKLRGGWTKYLARRAMDGKLPDYVVWKRDKLGWPSPDGEWFRGPLRDWAVPQVNGSKYLRDLGKGGDAAELLRSNPRALIQLFNVSLWHDIFFERQAEQHVEVGKVSVAKSKSVQLSTMRATAS